MAQIPASPIKGLSVWEDSSGRPAIHKKIGKNKYVCLANFFSVLRHLSSFRMLLTENIMDTFCLCNKLTMFLCKCVLFLNNIVTL